MKRPIAALAATQGTLQWRHAVLLFGLAFVGRASAHGLAGADAEFVAANTGPDPVLFLYLGAKHMVTGADHLLFLLGVIFYLERWRDVAVYVTLFSLGHSITLLAGVLGGVHADAYLIDAIIGLSVAFKAFDNLGGFRALLGRPIDSRPAVLVFGLFHGLGLATKLQALNLSPNGLMQNLLAFNVGVELGQLWALAVMLALVFQWRGRARFGAQAMWLNAALLAAGFLLVEFQSTGYLLQGKGTA